MLKQRLLRGHYDQRLYLLRSFVILNDRVTVLLDPLSKVSSILAKWDVPQAVNRWVPASETAEVIRMIESGPVLAGLASRPEQWRWSSAWSD